MTDGSRFVVTVLPALDEPPPKGAARRLRWREQAWIIRETGTPHYVITTLGSYVERIVPALNADQAQFCEACGRWIVEADPKAPGGYKPCMKCADAVGW